MDEFHKMCDHSIIQEKWEPKVGDQYVYTSVFGYHPYIVERTNLSKPLEYCCIYCKYNYSNFQEIIALMKSMEKDALTGRFVWLPRLDQLLMMPLGKGFCWYGLEPFITAPYEAFILEMPTQNYNCEETPIVFEGDTIEKALLFAVMYTHGLEWVDGECRKI